MNTMSEVAKLAKVSQTTVSRVVNDDPKVSEETTKAVRDAIIQLNYIPRNRQKNTKHKSLISNEITGSIALMLLDDSMDAHPGMALAKLKGAMTAAQEHGLSLNIIKANENKNHPLKSWQKNLLGILLWGRKISNPLPNELEALPHLWISSHNSEDGGGILTGNEEAGRIAANHLNSQKTKLPAAFYPHTDDPQHSMRINGFSFANHILGKEVQIIRPAAKHNHPFSDLAPKLQKIIILEMVQQFISLKTRPDSLFFLDDYQTALAYPILKEHGLRPMKDLQIVSCGNEAVYLNVLNPRPASIDLMPETTGALAVEKLLEIVNSQQSSSSKISILINPQLIPGD
jgi:DNA-binding LacI/PurR family transcriptional regulator